jgi:RNA polymerase sigma factor (sigma-70 family)
VNLQSLRDARDDPERTDIQRAAKSKRSEATLDGRTPQELKERTEKTGKQNPSPCVPRWVRNSFSLPLFSVRSCNTPMARTYIPGEELMFPTAAIVEPETDSSVTDTALIQAVQGGELHAFEALLDRHLDHVRAFIAVKLPFAHLADELTHETFVFAFRHIGEFVAGTAFRPWLLSIAFNKLRAETERFCREERNRLTYTEHRLAEITLQSPAFVDESQLDALHQCVEKVPRSSRHLLTLRYRDGHSTLEIARLLARTHAWVRTTLSRLRQQLRDCVESKLKSEAS